MLAGGLVKSDKAFGCSPMRRKVQEHSESDRHPSSTPPILFLLLSSPRNADKRVNTVEKHTQRHKIHTNAPPAIKSSLHGFTCMHAVTHSALWDKSTHKWHVCTGKKKQKKKTVHTTWQSGWYIQSSQWL